MHGVSQARYSLQEQFKIQGNDMITTHLHAILSSDVTRKIIYNQTLISKNYDARLFVHINFQ